MTTLTLLRRIDQKQKSSMDIYKRNHTIWKGSNNSKHLTNDEGHTIHVQLHMTIYRNIKNDTDISEGISHFYTHTYLFISPHFYTYTFVYIATFLHTYRCLIASKPRGYGFESHCIFKNQLNSDKINIVKDFDDILLFYLANSLDFGDFRQIILYFGLSTWTHFEYRIKISMVIYIDRCVIESGQAFFLALSNIVKWKCS